MTTRKKRASNKPARFSPSPPKKTPQRGSKRKESDRASKRRTATKARPTTDNGQKEFLAELREASERREKFVDAVLTTRLAKDFQTFVSELNDPEFRKLVKDELRGTKVTVAELVKAIEEHLHKNNVQSEAARGAGEHALATDHNREQLLDLFLPTKPADIEAARVRADKERQAYGRQAIEEFIQALRTTIEPEQAIITPLAEAIVRAAALLRDSANDAVAGDQDLADALLPAARAAVALTDLVNGSCAELTPEAHEAARSVVERWPRIHHSNARLNTETDKLCREWQIGAERPRKATAQDEPTPITTARDRTLDALCLLLPETLRGSYPVLPVLFDDNGKPIPPRTEKGELADPYKTVARFLVTIRHSKRKEPRTKALQDFLRANDAALARLPKDSTLRGNYAPTRKRLESEVQRINAPGDSNETKGPPPSAWLRPVGPALSFASGSRTRSDILHKRNLDIIAAGLTQLYARSLDELDARAALKAVIDLRIRITGKGKTGADSAARDYIATHLEKLKQLTEMPEAELREVTHAAQAEAQRLKQRT